MKNIQPKGTFPTDLWHSIEDIFPKILTCDFVVKLSDGTLCDGSFSHYLSQDILYLQQDNKALKIIADRSLNKKYSDFFLRMASDGIEVEKIMHNEYLSYFQIEEATEQSPAFSAYGRFILDHARFSPYPVAAVALLPCFWVYAETGIKIISNSIKNNKYQKFIDTYSGEEYTNYINQYIDIIEELGQKTSPEARKLMQDAFIKATKHELAVFEESGNIHRAVQL